MGVVVVARDNEAESGKLPVAEIAGELIHGDQILQLSVARSNIREVGKGIVMLRVARRITTRIPDARDIFGVLFPGLSRADQMLGDVVHTRGTGKGVGIRSLSDLIITCRDLEVVVYRRMGIGVILSGQAVLLSKTVEVGHR